MKKQRIIAVLGLSGVGKSTLLKQLAAEISFQHLQASALIKAAREKRQLSNSLHDSLRLANIDENQQLLIEGFEVALDPDAETVVLDGHSVVDTPNGLVAIEADVFEALGVERMIYLADKPGEIYNRRQADQTRNRPERTVDELKDHQERAILNAVNVCLLASVPIEILNFSGQHVLRHAIFGLSKKLWDSQASQMQLDEHLKCRG